MKTGTVVVSSFPGAVTTKRRPSVIVSSPVYHAARPDVILALITGQTAKANSKTDYILQDWANAGLNKPSAIRIFLFTLPVKEVIEIGELSIRDWAEVQKILQISLAV